MTDVKKLEMQIQLMEMWDGKFDRDSDRSAFKAILEAARAHVEALKQEIRGAGMSENLEGVRDNVRDDVHDAIEQNCRYAETDAEIYAIAGSALFTAAISFHEKMMELDMPRSDIFLQSAIDFLVDIQKIREGESG